MEGQAVTEEEEFEFRLRLEREKGAAPSRPSASQTDVRKAEPPTPIERPGARGSIAPIEAAAHLASGAIAAPISGVAGLVASALPGKEGAGAEVVKKVGNALTYEPRSEGGRKIADIVTKPLQWAHQGAVNTAEVAQDKLGAPPAVASAVQTSIEGLPLAFMRRKTDIAAQSRNAVRDATYEAARKEGYVFPPSATGAGPVNALVESTAARTMLNQEAILKNQQTTNKIAAKEVGIPENTPITSGVLEFRRNQIAEPYREASAIDPAVAADVKAMREARAEANRWYKFHEQFPSPKIEDRAKRLMERAETLEGYIDQAAQQAGKPDLLARLRKARQEIAKTYDVERALNLGTGDVSAATLGAMLDKGKFLSGGLETIAKAHQAFGPYMRDAASLANPGVNRSHSMVGIGAGASGMHGGVGLWQSGIPLVAGGSRALALSEPYQNAVGKPYYGNATTPNNTLAALLASIEARQQER